MIVAARVPSVAVLSTIVIGNVALPCPAGTVTFGATVATAGSLLASAKMRSADVSEDSVTVPLKTASPSRFGDGTVSAIVSGAASSTCMVAEPLATPARCAFTVTVFVPSSTLSFTAAIANEADVCPAGMITLTGTVSSAVRSASSVTVRSLAAVFPTVTVPVPVAPSVRFAGTATTMPVVSLSAMSRFASPELRFTA